MTFLRTDIRAGAVWGEKSDGREKNIREQENRDSKRGREGIHWRGWWEGMRGFQDERTLAG